MSSEPRGRPRAGVPLAEVQAQLYDLITAPAGAGQRLTELGRAPRDLEGLVRASGRLAAVERVDVYANMYFFRILEVLADEFAKIVTLIGAGAFHNLITDYLLAHRPAHPSLREVGARLPGYLATHPLTEDRPWLSELARLERLRFELFDGPDAEALTLDWVRALPPASLPDLALRAVPCLATLSTKFAIAPLWRALEDARAGAKRPEDRSAEDRPAEDRPATLDAGVPPPGSRGTILIWRKDLTVFHRALDADEIVCLPLLQAGTTFAAICERALADAADTETAARRAFELLARWIDDGVLANAARTARPASRP
jgi:hypothetical protein